ncbi:hypothetical protein SCUCBS95973_008867 [Sporothrix curviconia]|uniref:AB hydrolase-1 domain-containing protein n=1 Tax=Sporothrix curviconia TaxID=1260050 RepID=A0ABP0CQ93_9PEZI
MAVFHSEYIKVRHADVHIHVSVSGAAANTPDAKPTIVFLHYWGGSTRTWAQVAARVTDAGYRTASIDFRGWGLSVGPADKDAYSIALLADDIEDVLVKLHPSGGPVVLVGLSMGAKVAQVVANRIATAAASGNYLSVSAAVLAGPAPATPFQLPPDMREQQLHAYDAAGTASFVAQNVLTVSFRGDSNSSRLPEFLVDDMLRGNPPARAAWPAYAMAEDVTATSLGSLATPPPVLVLAAEKDVVEPPERVKSGVLASIAGAKLELIAGSGHLSPIDAQEAVAAAIVRFVGAVAETPSTK